MKSLLSASAMKKRYSTAPRMQASVVMTRLRAGRMVSPMITAARPITMVPMPIEMSAPPWVCTNSAPASATSAFDSARPQTVSLSVEMPWARAMRGLLPVARIARPTSDAKNRSISNLAAITMASSTSGLSQ